MIAGLIEGFYGTPWSHDERLDLLAFCADIGLTTWVHAPKHDPYHRERWREPYPEAELAQLSSLADVGRRVGLSVVYAIAPGLSIDPESEADFAALLAKCEQARSAGFATVQLLWDDIERRDGAAHARVSNRFADEFPQDDRLVVCPVDYAGIADSDYRRSFRAELDDEIVVYWTGPDVVPSAITRSQLEAAAAQLGGTGLLLWDNYPVNDFEPARLFLGPLRGRDPALFGSCLGLVANPMLQAIPSKLPLATIATFLNDPCGYDPLTAFERALERCGGEVVTALRALAPNTSADTRSVATMAELVDALAPGVDAATAVALLEPFV